MGPRHTATPSTRRGGTTLRANPDGDVEVEGERWGFRAVEVEDDRRERIWSEALLTYPGFTAYAKRAAPRRISVFVLEPNPQPGVRRAGQSQG